MDLKNKAVLEINSDCSFRRPYSEKETRMLWPQNEKEGLTGEDPNAGKHLGQKKHGKVGNELDG